MSERLAGITLPTHDDYTPYHAALGECYPDIMVGDLGGAEAMWDAGKLPFIHPMFKSNTPQATIQNIAAGMFDAQIEAWLRTLKTYCDTGRKAVVAYLPEFNGNWCVYATDDYDPIDFIVAWHSFTDMALDVGLDESMVLFAWCPNDTGWERLQDWFPHPATVQIVGGSLYNMGGFYPDDPWESFTDLADRFVTEVRTFTDKPIVVTQTGTGLNDSRSPAWIDDMVRYVNDYTNVEGVIYYNENEFALGEGCDWNAQAAILNGQRPDHWFETTEAPMIYFDLDQWQWGSRTNYPDGTKRPFNMDKVVIHWGGYTNPGDGQADEEAILRGWQRYHIDTKGWTDIAYNFAVGNSGLVYRLRGVNRSGATSGDYEGDGIPENSEALAVVWIGGQGHGISEAAKQSMGRVIRSSGQTTIIGHRNVKQTACPGDEWLDWIDMQGWLEVNDPVPIPPVEGDHQMQTVKRGDGYKANPAKKATVKAAQIMEAFHGFFDEKTEDNTCGADGIFGPGTETATKNFQQAKGLVIDGQVGPATWKALEV